jgi:hypothetical protein
MLRDIVDQSQTQISVIVEKKRIEAQEAQAKREAAEEAARLKNLEKSRLDEEERLKKEAEKAKAESATKKATAAASAVVSKDKVVNKAKRKNVVKMGAGKIKEADLLKMKKEAAEKKKTKKEETKGPAAEGIKAEEEKKEEASEEPSKKEAPVAPEKPAIKFLELSPAEEKDIKQKIYMSVYEEFLKIYQGNIERVKPLCQILGITLNPEDPNETLKAIFKRVRSKLRAIIDFEGDLPIRETLNIDELNLESPYKEISKEVKARLLFLLELKSSIDYHSKVIRVDTKLKRQGFGTSQTSQDGD